MSASLLTKYLNLSRLVERNTNFGTRQPTWVWLPEHPPTEKEIELFWQCLLTSQKHAAKAKAYREDVKTYHVTIQFDGEQEIFEEDISARYPIAALRKSFQGILREHSQEIPVPLDQGRIILTYQQKSSRKKS